jgi:glycosyltransferase involved in cell wall biosynthesis
MSNQPTVSVIVPVFNGAAYIREAIESVFHQTFKDYEIIVVDDGSTDNTKTVIDDWIKAGKVKYIFHENRGLAAARNTGLNAAQGRYIKFLDCDDFLYPEQLEKQVDQIQGTDHLISISDSCFLRPGGEMVERLYYPADPERQMASFFEFNPAPVHAYLASRALIQKVGNFDESLKACEDWDLWIRMLRQGALIKHLAYNGCCYRISLTSLSANPKKMLIEKCKVFEKVNEWLLKEENLKQKIDKWYWYESIERTNDRLLEECLARGISLDGNLSNVMRLTDLFYQAKLVAEFKKRYNFLGIKNYIRLQYFQNVLTRKNYRYNLLSQDLIWKRGDQSIMKNANHDGEKPHFVFVRRFNPDADWGGTEVVLMDWFSVIDFNRCKVTFVVPKGSRDKFIGRIQANGWPIEVLEFEFSYVKKSRVRFKELLPFFWKLKPTSIIYVMGWYLDFGYAEVLAGFVAAKGNVFMHENVGPGEPPAKTNQKHFGFINGVSFWWHKKRFDVNLKGYLSRKVLFVSEDVKEKFIDLWAYPRYKTLVLHHGTKPHSFFPSQDIRKTIRERYRLADSDIAIIATARLAEFKRLDRLIDAFDQAAAEFKNIKLFLAGVGPLEQELKQRVATKAARDRISFLGHVDNVKDLLRMSDIYVLSSDNEGLSLALLESMASGLICISTKCPGSWEAIESGVNGFLVEKSPEGVYDGLTKVLKLSPPARAQIGQNARQTVLERFDARANTKRVFTLFGVPY